jgi:hypothetical protein
MEAIPMMTQTAAARECRAAYLEGARESSEALRGRMTGDAL